MWSEQDAENSLILNYGHALEASLVAGFMMESLIVSYSDWLKKNLRIGRKF